MSNYIDLTGREVKAVTSLDILRTFKKKDFA